MAQASRSIPLERPVDGVEEGLILEWLLEEIDGARLHRANALGNVPETGDEDDRNIEAQLRESLLEVEAAQPRHSHVENEARRARRRGLREKFPRRGEGLDAQPDRPNKL
jgi:hypothetical protein